MQWQLATGSKTIRALRGADAGVDRAWRRRGIWTRLVDANLSMAGSASPVVVHGNATSQAGYRRRGWPHALRVRLWARPVASVPCVGADTTSLLPASSLPRNAWRELSQRRSSLVGESAVETNQTPEYLEWRYAKIPGLGYVVGNRRDEAYSYIGYIRKHGRFDEFRICDADQLPPVSFRHLPNRRVIVMTLLRRQGLGWQTRLPCSGFIPVPNRTTSVLVHHLAPHSREVGDWAPSFGDLDFFF